MPRQMKGERCLANALRSLEQQGMVHPAFMIGLRQKTRDLVMPRQIGAGRGSGDAFNGIMCFGNVSSSIIKALFRQNRVHDRADFIGNFS